jgi:hypothetical protein
MKSNLYTDDTSLLDLAHNNLEYERLINNYHKKVDVTNVFMDIKEFITQEKERVKNLFILPLEIEFGGDFKKGFGINFTKYKKHAYDMLTTGLNPNISNLINHAIEQHLIEKPDYFRYDESEFSSAIFNNLLSGVALKKYEKYLTDELVRIESENYNNSDSKKTKWYNRLWVKLLGIVSFLALLSGFFSDSCNLLDRFSKKENKNSNKIENKNDTDSFTRSRMFNSDTRDLGTILVSNRTINPCDGGPGIGCWSSSVNGTIGDTISVQIYFHNTTNETLNNVTIGMYLNNTDPDTVHTFKGVLSISGIPNVVSSATVNLSSSATLVFIPGSVLGNFNQGRKFLLYQESDLFSKQGAFFAKIEPGWNSQGTIRARFQVK